MNRFLHQIRRVCLILGIASAVWAVALRWTGGFYFTLAGIAISSRNTLSALEVAAGLVSVALALLPWTGGFRDLRRESEWWLRGPRYVWQHHRQSLPALAIILLVIGFDLYQWLAASPLWLDEETIALNARDRSVAELTGPLWLGQSAPLGWLALLRAVIRILGTNEIALRVLPQIFTLATLAIAIWIGRRWLNVLGALTLAWFCAFGHWLSYYSFEVKHYTADACAGLALPALAVWILESEEPSIRLRRTWVWWISCAVGLWFANGAVLVTPALAIFLTLVVWRADGRRAAMIFAAVGVVWLVSFAVHYEWSAKYALDSSYLHGYWAPWMPAPTLGVIGRLGWMTHQLRPLATESAGTTEWVTLWVLSVSGFVFGRRRRLGQSFALVPLSAFLFGAMSLVPLAGRLALWMVPSLYVGVALLVDHASQLAFAGARGRRWWVVAAGVTVIIFGVRLSSSLYAQAAPDLVHPAWLQSNHGQDDRSAVRWLMKRHHPGDAILATHMNWPALWWYGPFNLDNSNVADGILNDGTGLFEIGYQDRGSDCRARELRKILSGRRQALFYIGFRDVPDGYEDLIVNRLSQLGVVTDLKRFSQLSIAAVVDLTARPAPVAFTEPLSRNKVALTGCVDVRPALRW